MTNERGKAAIGEMRRRHEAIVRSGVLGKIRSEGRLVFALALCWADYKTCQFRMSARGTAKIARVQPTAIRRGLAQLIDHGVIEPGPKEPGKRPKYRFRAPQKSAHEPCAGVTHGVRVPLTHTVRPPDTPGAQSAHRQCAEGTPTVSRPRTVCAPYSSIVLKGSSRTRKAGPAVPDGTTGQPTEENENREGAA